MKEPITRIKEKVSMYFSLDMFSLLDMNTVTMVSLLTTEFKHG